jgi:hypothetical protein
MMIQMNVNEMEELVGLMMGNEVNGVVIVMEVGQIGVWDYVEQ